MVADYGASAMMAPRPGRTHSGPPPGWNPDEGPNPQHEVDLMSKAPHTLKPARPLVTEIDRRSWPRELWHDAYSMARRMVRARDGSTVTDAVVWFEHHAYRRFGIAAYPVVIAAGSLVFHQRVLAIGVTGS